jgi:hypothetical protein
MVLSYSYYVEIFLTISYQEAFLLGLKIHSCKFQVLKLPLRAEPNPGQLMLIRLIVYTLNKQESYLINMKTCFGASILYLLITFHGKKSINNVL